MSVDDLCHRPIPVLSALLRSRQVSPVEVAASFLDRIDRVEPSVNAFITVARDEATLAAEQAEAEMARGEYRGTMHGIPVGIKDLYDTAGIRTTSGSKIDGDRVPTADSAVVEGLKGAGAIIVGKLMMTEFAFGEQGRNAHYGDVRNPWDLARMPGGSSTGSAASVAASRVRRFPWERHGRFDPGTGGALRSRRTQADLWAGEPAGDDATLVVGSTTPGRSPAPSRARRRRCRPSRATTPATQRRRQPPFLTTPSA